MLTLVSAQGGTKHNTFQELWSYLSSHLSLICPAEVSFLVEVFIDLKIH